jgi:hypothetical protein
MSCPLLLVEKYNVSLFHQKVIKTHRFIPRRIYSNHSSRTTITTIERKANSIIQRYIDQAIFPIRGGPNNFSSGGQTTENNMGIFDEFWLRNVHERRLITMRILIWLGLVWLIPCSILDVDMPMGPSMVPTINLCGDVVLIWRFPTKRKYQVGDIVQCGVRYSKMSSSAGTTLPVVGEPTKEDGTSSCDVRYVIKRISRIIEEPGIVQQERFVWIEGDCPEKSYDSRHYGPISESCILGRVVLRLWPLGNMWFRPTK